MLIGLAHKPSCAQLATGHVLRVDSDLVHCTKSSENNHFLCFSTAPTGYPSQTVSFSTSSRLDKNGF